MSSDSDGEVDWDSSCFSKYGFLGFTPYNYRQHFQQGSYKYKFINKIFLKIKKYLTHINIKGHVKENAAIWTD